MRSPPTHQAEQSLTPETQLPSSELTPSVAATPTDLASRDLGPSALPPLP